MKQLLALMTIAFLLSAGTALAQGPCKDDKEKFCKEVVTSGGKVGPCLRQHMDELSAACKAKLTKPKEEKEEAADDKKPADATTDKPAESAPSGDGAATGGTGN